MPGIPGRRLHATRVLILIASGSLWLAGCDEQKPLPPVEGDEVTLTAENFDAEVLRSDVPVLVDFSATWCGPCQQLAPVLAHLSLDYKGRLKVGKVDVDEDPDLTTRFDVEGFPTMLLFENGEPVARQVGWGGGSTESGLKRLSAWVNSHVSTSPGEAAAE